MRNEPTPKIEAGAEPEKLGYSNWGEWFSVKYGEDLEAYSKRAAAENLREKVRR